MHDPTLDSPAPSVSPKTMPAEFGLPTATFIIVASMVGVGVLTTSGYTVNDVGSNQLMLGLWVLGGVVAAAGALTLCELSAALPRTGGDYVYLKETYGPLVAFLSGWVSFVLGFASPSAAAALSSAKYLCAVRRGRKHRNHSPRSGDGSDRILRGGPSFGATSDGDVQGWITAVKLALLVLFVIAGTVVGRSHFANLADAPPVAEWPKVPMMFSLVYIAYAYIGWNAASYLAGEFVEPQKQLPRDSAWDVWGGRPLRGSQRGLFARPFRGRCAGDCG